MKDREIDEILKRASEAPHDVDPALLDRLASSIGSSLSPVRPLPPAWVLTGGLVLICVFVASAGAAVLGLHGVRRLSITQSALIFPTLAMFIWLAAEACVSQMIPGSRRRIDPEFLLAAGSLALVAVFAILFRDYRTSRFLAQGLICLNAGLLHAIPTALASWWLLRRGFAVNAANAGLMMGTLAGLAGVTMLELHCANFAAPHIMLWHTAVLVVSAATGALLSWAAPFRRKRKAGLDRFPKH